MKRKASGLQRGLAAGRAHLERVLRHTHGKVHEPGGAAQVPGLAPSTLESWMKKLGVPQDALG